MKKFSYYIITFLFIVVSVFVLKTENNYHVLKVYNHEQIALDLNRNGKIDCEEIINLDLPTKDFETEEEQFAYNYFAKEFAIKLLEDNTVKYDNKDKTIKIFNQNYSDLLAKEKFDIKNIDNYRILNTKSNKYHHLSCPYGKKSSNYVLVRKRNLPEDSKPCKVCKFYHTQPREELENLATTSTPQIYDNGSIKVAATDLTKTLKPDNSCNTEICSYLKYLIDNSTTSIDLAIYGYKNVPKIKQALINAQKRGVKIRMVFDVDKNNKNYYSETLALSKELKNTNCDNQNINVQHFLMHNKFVIIDNKIVFTGSANLSASNLSNYNSNTFIVIKSEKVAQLYQKEFEQMYAGKFHNTKTRTPKNNFIIGSTSLSVYFSPQDKIITNHIIPLVNKSSKTIYMPTFLITHKELTNALINAKKRGVKIKIILDAANANNTHSQHQILRNNGIDVKVENYAGKMHSKTMIIDNNHVIIGSMNFSKSGENKNDENVVILQNPQIATFLINNFNHIWNKIPNKYLTTNVSAESKESIGSCYDGVDNNFNGKIDFMDSTCK